MQKAKYKHNKKRNTGIVYTILIQELTRSILNKDREREKKIKKIICEFFNKKTELYKEVEIYKQFKDIDSFSKEDTIRLLELAKKEFEKLDKKQIEIQKSKLIHEINKNFSMNFYSNFIPNYRLLASLGQIFSDRLSLKERIIIENNLLEDIESNKKEIYMLPSIDNLTFKTFVQKFNDKYSGLLKEQKELLFNYVISLEQNNLNFKFFLNEEIGRMKKILAEVSAANPKNKEIFDNKEELINKLNEFKAEEISQEMLTNILKIQEIVNTLCQSK